MRAPSQLIVPLLREDGGVAIELKYDLARSPLAARWAESLRRSMAIQPRFRFGGSFFGDFAADPAKLGARINALLERLDDGRLPFFSLHRAPEFTQTRLDSLHQLKEQVEALVTSYGFGCPRRFLLGLAELNDLIHRLEGALAPPTEGGLVFAVPEHVINERLRRADLRHFTLQERFGGLYLGYGTNGVDLLNGFLNRTAHAPVPQTELTGGFCLWLQDDRPAIDRGALDEYVRERLGRSVTDPDLAVGVGALGTLAAGNPPRAELLARAREAASVGEPRFVPDPRVGAARDRERGPGSRRAPAKRKGPTGRSRRARR